MVWVLPCNFDARHCHGGVNIRNTKVINIFNGSRRSGRCYGGFGFGFGGGFWPMFGKGIGIGLGMGIFNGLFGGNGLLGNIFGGNGGWFGGGQQGGGCTCGHNSYNNYSSYNPYNPYNPYIPGQYSTIGKVSTQTQQPQPTQPTQPVEQTPPTPPKKEAEVVDNKYNLDDLLDDKGNPKNPLSSEEAKEARKNFWTSIGLDEKAAGLDKAWNNNRLQLAKDGAGNVYVIYKDEQGNKTAFKYDPDTKQYKLPDGTTFNKFSENCTDEVAKPKNIDETKNQNVTQNWSEADAEVTTVTFDGRDKQNGNCVKVGSTFGSWLLNHNDASIAQVTKNSDKIFEEYAHGDDKISFDEFIAYLSGYEADAMRATADTAYGAGSRYHDTVDMDAYDMVKLTKIFNKYATNGNIDKAGFDRLIAEMNQLKNSNVIV